MTDTSPATAPAVKPAMVLSGPRVTVSIPTYNAGTWIEAAVESVLAQTLTDFELLVFDNASTDDTPARMARFSDPRLTYRFESENVGFAGNVSRAMRAGRGQYFMVLGADDILEPDFLARAVALLEANPGAAMLHGGAVWIDDDGHPHGRFAGDWPAVSPPADAFIRCFTQGFCYSTVISRMAPIKALGGMGEHWGAIADTWLFLRLCLAGEVLFMAEPLVRYRVRESSLSFELYADGRMFRDHLRGAREAFGWPEAAALGLPARSGEALEAVAREAVQTLHMARLGGGLAGALARFRDIAAEVPGVLRLPGVWLRLGFALLPAPLIRALRRGRRGVGQRTA